MKTLWSLTCLVFIFASTLAVQNIDDTLTYEPCFPGGCEGAKTCFQYFCYPKKGQETPLKSCRRDRDCSDLVDHKCFKQSIYGVCVSSADYEKCGSHEDCEGRGGKCCGDYCCNEEYFEGLQSQNCTEDDEVCQEVQSGLIVLDVESLACDPSNDRCEQKHGGHKCCADNPLLEGISLSNGDSIKNWNGENRCCMNAAGVRALSEIEDLTADDIDAIDEKIAEKDDKRAFCKGLEEHLQDDFPTCVAESAAEAEEIQKAKEAQAALEEAMGFSEEAIGGKELAENSLASIENATSCDEGKDLLFNVETAADDAQASANDTLDAAVRARDAGSLGNEADEADDLASQAQEDANAAKAALKDAQDAVDKLCAPPPPKDKPETINDLPGPPEKGNMATNIQMSSLLVISAVMLYQLLH